MRVLLAGLVLLLGGGGAFAQAVGEVESVGFNNAYRPDCWTPMVVRLRPQTAEAGTFQLQVWQHDGDGDRAVYTRTITLNGNDVAVPDQRFWMYFLPQPTNRGLPDAANGGTLKDLQRELKVFLCTAAGKQIVQLPITSTLQNIDPYRDLSQEPRGCKLVLAISDGGDAPAWRDYQTAVGIKEDVEFVNLTTKDLPEDPLGYEAVDSIAWFDADPADLDRGGQHKLQTLQDYVRFGGQLVICQPTTDWQKTLNFGALLPVTIESVQSKADLEPLRSMAVPREPDPYRPSADPWTRPVGPFVFARAEAKPGAVVDRWIDWNCDGSYADATPYLVRQAVGLGQVTWVANNLGNPAISLRATTGWPYVWDTIFGWNNDTYVPPASVNKDDPLLRLRTDLYSPANPIELGKPLVDGLNFEGKAATLITVAVVFFVLYWVVAGPGGYFVLSHEKKTSLSWFVYAAAAVVATALTGLVVKLAVRGSPQIKQISFVRMAPNQPALIYSRMGLYIPRDGDQTLQLNDTTHQGVSYLSGFAEHPQLLGDASEFPAPADYTVPVRDSDSSDAPSLTVPYRSSMKKFQSCWIGDQAARFSGKVRLDEKNEAVGLAGYLSNETGQDFDDVYVAFHRGEEDRVIYFPHWAKNATVDLSKDLVRPVSVGHLGNKDLAAYPGDGRVIADTVGNPAVKAGDSRDRHWIGFWYGDFYHNNGLEARDPTLKDAFPMLSLFDRLPPDWNTPADPAHTKGGSDDRFELFRRGGRVLDASASVMAGQLLILASNTGPLPVPLQVDGSDVGGTGTVLYQFLLPIDRGEQKPPSTQKAE